MITQIVGARPHILQKKMLLDSALFLIDDLVDWEECQSNRDKRSEEQVHIGEIVLSGGSNC